MKMKRLALFACAALTMGGGFAPAARATMIGDTVGAEFEQPNDIPGDVIYNAGTTTVPNSLSNGGTNTLAFTDGKVTLTWSNSSIYQTLPFSGWMLYDSTHPFTGVSVESVSGFVNLTNNFAFLSGPNVYLNLEGSSYSPNARIVLDLRTVASPGAPEPASLVIVAIGLIATSLASGRKPAQR